MATVEVKPSIDTKCHFTVDYEEACALVDLAGYGTDAFIKAFYEKLGQAYMQRHEKGLRRFLDTITSVVQPAINQVNMCKTLLQSK